MVSTLFSVEIRRSLDTTLALLTAVLIFFLICDLILYGWRREIFELALLIFVGCLFILSFREIINHYWSWYTIRVPEYPLFLLRFRLFGVTAHPNLFAMLVYITLPFAILRLARAHTTITKLIWIIWILMATIVSFFINSRGGLIATSITLFIILGWILTEDGVPKWVNLKTWFYKNWKVFFGIFAYLLFFVSMSVLFQVISP